MNTVATPPSPGVMGEEWNKQALIEALKQIRNDARRLKKDQVSAQTIAKLAENVRLLASIVEIIVSQTVHY
jgi:hypothetical protein